MDFDKLKKTVENKKVEKELKKQKEAAKQALKESEKQKYTKDCKTKLKIIEQIENDQKEFINQINNLSDEKLQEILEEVISALKEELQKSPVFTLHLHTFGPEFALKIKQSKDPKSEQKIYDKFYKDKISDFDTFIKIYNGDSVYKNLNYAISMKGSYKLYGWVDWANLEISKYESDDTLSFCADRKNGILDDIDKQNYLAIQNAINILLNEYMFDHTSIDLNKFTYDKYFTEKSHGSLMTDEFKNKVMVALANRLEKFDIKVIKTEILDKYTLGITIKNPLLK